MPLKIIRNDITKVECDAIVNAASTTLLGGGGVDGAIHKAAGKGLLAECKNLGGCKAGQAKITKAYKLPCKYVIHTVGPKWTDGQSGERALLQSYYAESLNLALSHKCESVAFPLISSGVYGYPKDQALKVAVDTITKFLFVHDIMVYIVVFDKSAFQISEKLFSDVSSFIDDRYVDTHFIYRRNRLFVTDESDEYIESQSIDGSKKWQIATPRCTCASAPKAISLEDMVSKIDESFSQMLLRKIDEKGITDAQCYKKANAFLSCYKLNTVTIPDTVTSIGDYAFAGCRKLLSVTIPASVTQIGTEAFGYTAASASALSNKIDGFEISGYSTTAAQSYALANDFEFIRLIGAGSVFELGDIDRDGAVNILDATAIQLFIAKLTEFDEEQILLGYYAGDGYVDVMDATAIQLKLAGLA